MITRRTTGAAAALVLALTVVATASAQTFPGFKPDAVFRTPESAAYCYVDVPGYEVYDPQLFCWTPNDGWAVWITATGRRATTRYFTTRPRIVHDIGVLKDYRPRALLLPFGERWDYVCADLRKIETCYSGRYGKLAFRCSSAASGLTCRNALHHGFWIGRFRGYRLF